MKIVDVLMYEKDHNTVIWKHEVEDFNRYSQLVVQQSQEAIFVMNGVAMDTFGPGRYTLETENIPLITKAMNFLTTGGDNPFHCELYFINKVEQMAIKWGSPEQFYVSEDVGGQEIPIKIGARGEMSIKVDNSRKLLMKLVGTDSVLTQDKLMDYFFGIVVSKVKTSIAKTMRENKISVFTVDEHLTLLSDVLKPLVEEDLLDYGIQVEKFMVLSIKRPDGDPEYEKYKRIKYGAVTDIKEIELEQMKKNIEKKAEVERMIMESQGMAIKRQQEGYTYQQERSFDVAGMAAANEGVGEYSNLGIGLGMMTGVGAGIGSTVGNMANGALGGVMATATPQPETKMCPKCNTSVPKESMFCFKCGEKFEENEMIKCPNCEKLIPKGMFCMYCGHKFEEKKTCAKCGQELVAGAAFCMSCGEKID